MCYSWRVREENKGVDIKIAKAFVCKNINFIENINFGTGENTLLPEWYNLVKWCAELGFKQGVTTNGYLAVFCEKNKSAKEIITNSLNDVDVSLDFADPFCHNKFRGHPKAYEWAIKTLRYCREYGKEVSIAICLTRENCNLKNIKKLFRLAETFESNIRINIYRPLHGSQFVVPPRQTYNVLHFILKTYRLVRASDPLFSSLLKLDDVVGDSSGNTSCRILPNGSITPSTYLITKEWITRNIKEIPLLPELRATEPFRRLITAPIPRECKKCMYLDICQGGAKDRRILWYNDLRRRDPYCPFQYFNQNPFENLEFSVAKRNIYLVHDGYLPTLIFSP